MQKMQRQSGFTLFELMIVITIMGVIAAMVVPGLVRYQRKEETRNNAHTIAAALKGARDRSIREGGNYIVLFDLAVANNQGQIGVVVQDVNADFAFDPGDVVVQNIFLDGVPAVEVVPYGMGGMTPFNAAPRHPVDLVGGNLGTVANGVGFNPDPLLQGVSPNFTNGLAFTPQGIPVAAPNPVNTPPVWGSGTGAYYLTDSNNAVFAVSVGALGEVRVSTWNDAAAIWN